MPESPSNSNLPANHVSTTPSSSAVITAVVRFVKMSANLTPSVTVVSATTPQSSSCVYRGI